MENIIKLPTWFVNNLNTVMKYNGYKDEMITATVCDKANKWTPCDLIIREYYNNGCGSSKGFLNLSSSQAEKMFVFIKENQQAFKEMDYYSKDGYNNFGFPLWKDYQLD